MTAIEIPSSVETIGERIFRRCTGLVNVTFEKGSRLTSITGDCVKDSGNRVTSYGAFLECTSLTKIEIPASVTTIGSGAFHDCSSLEIVSFEEGSKLITIKDGYKDGGNTVYGAFTNCDNLTLFDASNCTQIKTIGNYAFVLDGVENRIKELRKFPSLTFDLNYIEQTEIDQLAQQIETTMQSDLKAKDQLLKKIRNNPLCNVDMENIIQRRNWKYKKLNNTIKGNRFSWLELYQQAGIKNSVSQFISGYMSEFVHGLCMSNIAYNTPPFEKGQILNINTVFINKTTDIIKKLFQNDLAKNDIDIRKSDIATSLLLMVTPEYISEKLLQIADKTKATQHS